MIEETAEVVRVEPSRIWVRVDRRSACASCSSSAGCGQKRLIEWLPSKTIELELANPHLADIEPGHQVVLGLDEGAMTRASLLLYGAPLAGLVLFALVAALLQTSEPIQIVSSIIGLIVGFSLSRFVSIRALALGSYEPRLLSVVHQ